MEEEEEEVGVVIGITSYPGCGIGSGRRVRWFSGVESEVRWAADNCYDVTMVQLKNEAKSNLNQTMVTVDTLSKTVERLDKISKVAISCSELAQKGRFRHHF